MAQLRPEAKEGRHASDQQHHQGQTRSPGVLSMVRMQIRLSAEQVEALKRLAAERGVSVSELVRRAVDAFLAGTGAPTPEELRRRALSIIGMVIDGPTDMSARHDDYAVEAYEE